MKNLQIKHRVLIGSAMAAILYLFFHQANIALDTHRVSFDDTPIAYGYSSVAFTGTVYTDEGVTAVSQGSGVALHINGSAQSTTTTNASGVYSFSGLELNQDDIVTVYIDNEVEDGVLVAKFNDAELSDQSVTGMDIYADRLILRSETTDRNITTTNLATAANVGDADVSAVYTISSASGLVMGYDKELIVWEGTTHTTSGSILTHDLDVRGTLTMASSADITASGSFVILGDITTTGDVTLTSFSSGETLKVSDTSLNNLYIDYGVEAYFRLDEGSLVNATGATLNTATGGSLAGSTAWVQSNTGTTLFYNPFALEFDGTNDRVTFGDAYDINDSSTLRTYSAWFRRKSATTEDVIFSKKSGSGASNAGYMLYIDDESDALVFEVANGTNNYQVTSNTTITDESWHHVAVSYNPLDVNGMNIFIDGSIDVSAKSGGLESAGKISGTFSNSELFQVGRAGTASGGFVGSIDDFRIYSRVMSGSELSLIGTGYRTSGSGTYYLRDDLDVNGDFCIYGGTLDGGTGHTISVAGDYCAYEGKLLANNGSFVLDGTSQTIRGSSAFNQISKTNTSTVTLTFEVNTEQTVSGAITLRGALNNQIDLRTTRSGSQAYLIVEDSGATLLKYLDVQDNNAFSGALMNCTEGCIDSDNNVNWTFFSVCGDGLVGGSEQCDDGNSNNLDTCPNDCQFPVCGDNVLEGLEECEPPNSGTCLSNCLERSAGGGGTNISSSSAASFFKRPKPPDGCGNAIFEPEKGEECDSGTRFNGLGTCSFDCKLLTCGDGIISPQIGEDCEPKVKSETDGVKIFEVSTCGETCTAPELTPQGTYVGGCQRLFLHACGGASSSSPMRPSAPGFCGNGVVDSGEECDFGGICEGGSFDGSFWTDAASAQTCTSGGGTPKPSSGDGCSDTCLSEFCGDGFIQQRGADNQPGTPDDEECDNGSVCSNNAGKTCRLNSDCGEGATCDYHAAQNSACSSECKVTATPAEPEPEQREDPVCGNGRVEGTEECDDGDANGAPDSSCSDACIRKQIAETPAPQQPDPRCGDGIVQGEEQCDDGGANSDINPDSCRTNCRLPFCGDFVLDQNEQCDNGDGNGDFFADTCRTDCSLPRCGDGTVDSGEECDGGLSCTPACEFIATSGRCGNAIVEAGEECDDGNTASGDGCSAFCQRETPAIVESVCGNGTVETGEECDDGNAKNGDTCSSECRSTEPVRAAAAELVIDADVVVVNPEEYANALKFVDGDDPCSVLTIKGMNQKAVSIRVAANRQNIPIVRNIGLARSLYAGVNPGQQVFGHLCAAINELKPKQVVPKQPLPQQPTIFSYGFYNYAQLQPIITANPPAGDTGPGTVAFVVSGAAGGMGWIRHRRRR